MAFPGHKRVMCGHTMALFNAHSKCASCREKGLGTDDCVQNKDCEICNNKFTVDQKKQLATPTYRVQK